jgi:adenosylcobinamide-GDP ribazoletransferase
MLKKEIRYFFTALMFLTRLPVPRYTDHRAEYLEKSSRYFPVVGWIVGVLVALVFAAGAQLNTGIGILLSMVASLLVTGAFHEDGLADVCDAFGGGWTKEKILTIMKDSRLGTFGTVALIMVLLVKASLLWMIAGQSEQTDSHCIFGHHHWLMMGMVFVAAHSISRLMPLVVIHFFQYVFQDDLSKSKPLASSRMGVGAWVWAIATAALPVLLLHWQYALALAPMLIAVMWMGRFFKKWIGGYTGDCLGAVQQVTEIVFLLSIIIINKYRFNLIT